jgi:hypothetical protein
MNVPGTLGEIIVEVGPANGCGCDAIIALGSGCCFGSLVRSCDMTGRRSVRVVELCQKMRQW